MSKPELKQAAIELRQAGKSIRDITNTLNVSKASVSKWVCNVRLSEEQIKTLASKNPCYNGSKRGSNGLREKYRSIRQGYQEIGREEAKKKDWLYVAGCMLYWGEGFKSRNLVGLGNSDPELLKFFLRFLRECFNVQDKDISMRVQCHVDLGTSLNSIQEYWLTILNLDRSCLRTASIDQRPCSSIHKGKARKLPYGVCRIVVHSTELVNRIYGAIQEIAGFTKEEWLN